LTRIAQIMVNDIVVEAISLGSKLRPNWEVGMSPTHAMSDEAARLRLGVLVDGDSVKPWQAELLKSLVAAHDGTSPPLIMAVPSDPVLHGAAGRAWSLANAIERPISRRVHHRSFVSAGRDGDARRSLAAMGIEVVDKASSAQSVDVVVDLRSGNGNLPEGLRPELGTVRFRSGAVNPATGEADGAIEFAEQRPLTKVRLGFWPSDGSPYRELARQFRTYPNSWSENVRRMEWRGYLFLRDELEDIAKRGRMSRLISAAPPAKETEEGQGSLAAALGLPRMAWRTALALADRISIHDQWRVLVTERFERPADVRSYASWSAMVPPPGVMWADPFVKVVDGRTCVFVEEVTASIGRGSIVCLDYRNGVTSRLGTVIEQPYHLSYPFLLEFEGALYMLPESSEDRALHVWRCIEYPMRWEKVATMMEGISIADCTIFEHEGRWWLFGNPDRLGVGIHTSELHIFSSDNPIHGRWEPHRLNPVLVDDANARMAGTVTLIEGGLYRFAQGSGRYYGETLEVRRIKRLSMSEYDEERVELVEPDRKAWGIGIHHFSRDGRTAVVDACYRVPNPGWRGRLAPFVRALS
jgi:hypothetical protein